MDVVAVGKGFCNTPSQSNFDSSCYNSYAQYIDDCSCNGDEANCRYDTSPHDTIGVVIPPLTANSVGWKQDYSLDNGFVTCENV